MSLLDSRLPRVYEPFMDLFRHASPTYSPDTPLAERLRPKTLDELLGQTQSLGPGTPLRILFEKDQIPSLIIWGPPGCGKTSLAMALAKTTSREFVSLNAIDAGAKVLREQGEAARERRLIYQKGTLVFVDEIHRLNKAQQDVLLPFVERGDFVLIGATTENPSFQINSALLSRCRLLVFKSLEESALRSLATKALNATGLDIEKALSPECLDLLLRSSEGDGRRLLNGVEQVIQWAQVHTNERLEASELPKVLGERVLYHDRKGESHYNLISAFIKAIRGSDPNAGVYYLARLLEAGEDPLFIARRLVILASEDVGNADPRGLPTAIAGYQAVEFVGLPEAAINLAQVVTYLASAPKSNRSYKALRGAQSEVRESGNLGIPLDIRNAPTQMMKDLGYGQGYQYAHEGEKGWLPQEFLPTELRGKVFYEPSERGFEKQIKSYLEWLKQQK